MTATELLDAKKGEIDVICRRFYVKRLHIFGSALTREWDEQKSDFDFLVEYSPESRHLPAFDRLVGLKLALEDLLGHNVDVVNLALTRNILFREAAEAQSQEFYAA